MGTPNIVARAFASPGVALLAVKPTTKIKNLAGWGIIRKDVNTGVETELTSKAPFKGTDNPNYESRSTFEWPIQKPVWKDFSAPANTKLQWGFVPVYFDSTQPSGVRADRNNVTWTNVITLTTDLDDEITVAFTNGFLSTQWLARKTPKLANGDFDFATLLTWLSTPKNAIRVHQAGDALPLLMSAIQQARAEGGRVYLILYELTDKELIDLICANADVVEVILAVIPGRDGQEGENEPARQQMQAAGVKVTLYAVASDQIAHNKVVIYADKDGVLCYIIGGSTNWTTTGLTTQSNTVIRIKSTPLATLYKKYHDLLVIDSAKKPTQSAWLRARLAKKPPVVVLKSGARVQCFFTPNTQERTKPKTPHPLPPDRAFGSSLFRSVEEMLTALFFMPGTPSYLDDIRYLSENKPDLSVLEVAVSSFQALQKGDVLLQHRPGEPSVAVVATAIEKAFGDYVTEILKLPDAHAIIHTKAAQGDARHKNRWKVWCMVTSHNGGDKASYSNNENVLFIFGHRALAIAMMVNHMDVTDHYRFRMMVRSNTKNDTLQGFLSQDDSWEDKYFVDGAASKELDYLTRDDEPEEDGPIPDFLAEDPDPKAVDNWGNTPVEWETTAIAAEMAEFADNVTTPATTGEASQGHSTSGETTPAPKRRAPDRPDAGRGFSHSGNGGQRYYPSDDGRGLARALDLGRKSAPAPKRRAPDRPDAGRGFSHSGNGWIDNRDQAAEAETLQLLYAVEGDLRR